MAYFLSTEILPGLAVRNPLPLQTRTLDGARRIAARNWRKPFGSRPVTVALLDDSGAIVDVYDGAWQSELDASFGGE